MNGKRVFKHSRAGGSTFLDGFIEFHQRMEALTGNESRFAWERFAASNWNDEAMQLAGLLNSASWVPHLKVNRSSLVFSWINLDLTFTMAEDEWFAFTVTLTPNSGQFRRSWETWFAFIQLLCSVIRLPAKMLYKSDSNVHKHALNRFFIIKCPSHSINLNLILFSPAKPVKRAQTRSKVPFSAENQGKSSASIDWALMSLA